jgi:hypothetical protein
MIVYILEVCRAAETFRTAKKELLRREALSYKDSRKSAARGIKKAKHQVEEARQVLRDFCRT